MNEEQTPTTEPLTREQICQLPHKERKRYVEAIFVQYGLFVSLREQIQSAIEESQYSADPKCIYIVGPTGAGKTSLLASCMEDYLTHEKSGVVVEGNIRKTLMPAIWVTFTQPARIRNVEACILRGFNDPLASVGDKLVMEDRIKAFAKEDCLTKVMFGDEIQELWNKDSQKAMHEATDWLKYIIKDLRIAIVFAGLEGDAENVINHNTQLKRLFGKPRKLLPFEAYDPCLELSPGMRKTSVEKTKFIQFLCDVELQLPFKDLKFGDFHIYNEDVAWRCFAASRGRVGYLMKIIRGGANLALDKGLESITLGHLASSFEVNGVLDIDNPFIGLPPKYPLPPLISPQPNDDKRKGKRNKK